MPFSTIDGQPRAVESLKAALRSDGVHHAYLFGGPEGVGKELTAIALAQALTCTERAGEGCAECSSCVRVARRNHPDVSWVMPEDEQVARGLAGRSDFDRTPSREIRVEQIRRLQERLAFRPLESKRKVAIVATAHAMNDSAQNAFLKTLEEPPPDTVLVLISSAPETLLPTIRSRCARVQFAPLPASLVAERLRRERELDGPTAELVAVLAGGSLSRALALDVKGLERRREILERFESLSKEDARGWLRFAEDFGAARDTAEHCLRILSLWNRDVAAVRAGAAEIANRDLADLARKAASGISDEALHRRHALIEQATTAIAARYGSPRLQLERLLIELMA
ncbi:MAG: DNA polymerase III subunit delta' [Myxococcales bacterium]|nr:DNA polymerase III subunit delta' [Myxococcales bacterium]